jgi:hypothetical protein
LIAFNYFYYVTLLFGVKFACIIGYCIIVNIDPVSYLLTGKAGSIDFPVLDRDASLIAANNNANIVGIVLTVLSDPAFLQSAPTEVRVYHPRRRILVVDDRNRHKYSNGFGIGYDEKVGSSFRLNC